MYVQALALCVCPMRETATVILHQFVNIHYLVLYVLFLVIFLLLFWSEYSRQVHHNFFHISTS